MATRRGGLFLEFKPAKDRSGSLATSLAGFANAEGGTLIYGVAERVVDGRKTDVIEGVPDVKIATDHLYTAATLYTPKLMLPAPEQIDVAGKTVLAVTIAEGLGQVYGVEGRYVVREAPIGVRWHPRRFVRCSAAAASSPTTVSRSPARRAPTSTRPVSARMSTASSPASRWAPTRY